MLLVFLRCASRCPIAVASREGGNLFSVAAVSPSNGGRNPLLRACFRVDMDGEKSAAWANATKSAAVLCGWLMWLGPPLAPWILFG